MPEHFVHSTTHHKIVLTKAELIALLNARIASSPVSEPTIPPNVTISQGRHEIDGPIVLHWTTQVSR